MTTVSTPDGAAATDRQQPPLQLHVFTSPTRAIGGSRRTFSPTTSTLVVGDTHAVLVDAQFFTDDVDALGDLIERTGRALTTIVITHGHGDHYFGSDRLAARFPGARVVATPGVVRFIEAHRAQDVKMFSAMFGGDVVLPTSSPIPLEDEVITLDGREVRVIEVGQGDVAPTAVVHVPSLDAVIAGDIAYNQIHAMLGFGGPSEWEQWIASLDAIERLRPRIVVAGHKKREAPDGDAPAILDGTRAYIRDFADAAASSSSAEEIVATMQARYPAHGNLTTLLYSADAAMKHRAVR